MNSEKDYLIETIDYDCPFCDFIHPIQIRKRITQALVKNEPVDYEQIYYLCDREKEEFAPAKVMDENLLRSKDAYRAAKRLLTSEQIKDIRQNYGLTQKEFSNLLGWGDITIQRYEKKLIQDETYDNLLRIVGLNPSFGLELLDKHQAYFDQEQYAEIRKTLILKIKEKSNEYLKIQEIRNSYLEYEKESDFNGFKKVNIPKINVVLSYFPKFINPLYKVKLMKLLWYSDAIYFKNYGKSMTGLVYQHLPMGAVPVAYNDILYLSAIKVEEELFEDYTGYRIYANKEINLSAFTLEELSVLNKVAGFFKDKTTREIVNYMHDEKAYRETVDHQVIPYSLAKEIREF